MKELLGGSGEEDWLGRKFSDVLPAPELIQSDVTLTSGVQATIHRYRLGGLMLFEVGAEVFYQSPSPEPTRKRSLAFHNFPFAPNGCGCRAGAEVLEESAVSTNWVYELQCLKTENERLRDGARDLEEKAGVAADTKIGEDGERSVKRRKVEGDAAYNSYPEFASNLTQQEYHYPSDSAMHTFPPLHIVAPPPSSHLSCPHDVPLQTHPQQQAPSPMYLITKRFPPSLNLSLMWTFCQLRTRRVRPGEEVQPTVAYGLVVRPSPTALTAARPSSRPPVFPIR